MAQPTVYFTQPQLVVPAPIAEVPKHLQHNARPGAPYVWRARLGDGTRRGRHKLAFFATQSDDAITAGLIARHRYMEWASIGLTLYGRVP